jgi:nucleoid-associated protein YgaU
LATKADASATTASLALKADLSSVNTSLNTKLDTSIFNTQIETKADLSSLQSTNTTLTQKANQSDVDTALAAKADLSALNSTNTTLTTKANITDMNSALALKADTTDLDAINTSLTSKAPQTSLDTTNTNLGTLTSTVSSLSTQVNSQASQDTPFAQIPQVYTELGLNANGNGESFYHNGHRLAAQSFLVGKDKFQETQPEDSYFRYIGYIDLLNDYTQGSYDFNDPYGEIRFRNNCKIRMKDNSVETLVPFTQTSDGRAKTNKEGIRSGLDAVLRLKPQTYEKHGKTESGFITQEVLEIPELKHLVDVPENKDEYQSLNYIGIIAHLVSAIQELNNKLK